MNTLSSQYGALERELNSVGSRETVAQAEMARKTRAVASQRSMRRVSSGPTGARNLQKRRFRLLNKGNWVCLVVRGCGG